MNIQIVTALITLGSLGLLFGIVLAIASKVFFVKKDPRIEKPNHDALGIKEIAVKRDEMTMVNVTERSFIEVSCVCKHNIYTKYTEKHSETRDKNTLVTTIEGEGEMKFTKYAVYTDTLRFENPLEEGRELVKAHIKKDFSAHE